MDTVHITDERMTRFWINIEKAFDIVLFGLANMEGGEIFIPKAPAMKLIELFDLVVPNAKREVIGIRPGEKIHEVLLTREEARHSVSYGDYFVILPEKHPHIEYVKRMEKYTKDGQLLPGEFSFTSDNTDIVLTHDDLLRFVKQMEELIAK